MPTVCAVRAIRARGDGPLVGERRGVNRHLSTPRQSRARQEAIYYAVATVDVTLAGPPQGLQVVTSGRSRDLQRLTSTRSLPHGRGSDGETPTGNGAGPAESVTGARFAPEHSLASIIDASLIEVEPVGERGIMFSGTTNH